MITKIVAQLKTGIIKNVVPYGVKQLPATPYVVVRPYRDPFDRGWMYRITVHYEPGQNTMLEDYVFNDLSDLLDNFSAESRHGSYNTLLTENDFTGIVVDNDDGSISMERTFLLPTRIF